MTIADDQCTSTTNMTTTTSLISTMNSTVTTYGNTLMTTDIGPMPTTRSVDLDLASNMSNMTLCYLPIQKGIIVCTAAPLGGASILSFLCFFCCCCCFYKKKRKGSRMSRPGLEEQEQTINPVDLSTGQISGLQELTAESNLSTIEKNMMSKSSVSDLLNNQSDKQRLTQSLFVPKIGEQVTNTSTSPPSTIQLPRSNTYEKIIDQNDTGDCQEPNYDEIETVLEHSAHWQAPLKNKYKNEAVKGGPDYEEVTSSGLSKDVKNSKDQYDVLASGMETNLLQKGIIQEDSNSPNEDEHYSTAREHKLVPVGRQVKHNNDNHLYEALSLEETKTQQGSSRYEQIQSSHLEKQKKAEAQSPSATEHALEKLDPMYDEPLKTDPPDDIYSDSLFDDPKYACKKVQGNNGSSERRGENTIQPQGQEIHEKETFSQ